MAGYLASGRASLGHVLARHASGRPWLVGEDCGELRLAVEGSSILAVSGVCGADDSALALAAARLRSVSDLDGFCETTPGSFLTLVSVDGVIRLQGPLSQRRRVFWRRLGDVDVAADRADVLARLSATAVDEAQLAIRLLYPTSPPPLDQAAMWRGVEVVPGGSHLTLNEDGRARVQVHWRPPNPDVPVEVAAPELGRALDDAITARLSTTRRVSADLSGGLDSTTLCFLTAERSVPLTVFRQDMLDPANSDEPYARLAAGALPNASHIVRRAPELPGRYAHPGLAALDPEEPYVWSASQADHQAVAALVADAGSRLHLTGHGGDEAFAAPPSYLHHLLRTRPWAGLRHLRGHQVLRRWEWRPLRHDLRDSRPFDKWLLDIVPPPVASMRTERSTNLSWGRAPALPPWATRDAFDLVTSQVRAVAGHAVPYSPIRAQHAMIAATTLAGRSVRLTDRLFRSRGVHFEAPYLDDRIVRIALSTRLDQHSDPRVFKPLLGRAVVGRVPDQIVGRTSKGEFSAEFYEGLSRHRKALCEELRDGHLATRGLIDGKAVVTALNTTYPTIDPIWWIDMTLSCERWLQTEYLRS